MTEATAVDELERKDTVKHRALMSQWDREACELDLAWFVRRSWPFYETARYLHNWHIDLVSDHVQACYLRQIKRLIINFPPRMMKSGIVTIGARCWWWTRDPGERFVFTSYSSDLSRDHSMARRRIILSEWYRDNWWWRTNPETDGDEPWVQLHPGQQEKSEFHSTRGGKMVASSVGASITGKGGNVIVVDDLLNPEQAESETERLRANNFFDQTLYSRLDDKINGIIMVVMQRLHEDDLTGHLLKSDEDWTLLKIPVQPRSTTTYHFLMQNRTIVRHPGDLMWPEREGPEQLKAARVRLGGRAWAGQYEQEPSPAEGNILKRAWFERAMWKHGDLPRNDRGEIQFDWIGQYWDMSFKDPGQSIQRRRQGKQVDYVVPAERSESRVPTSTCSI